MMCQALTYKAVVGRVSRLLGQDAQIREDAKAELHLGYTPQGPTINGDCFPATHWGITKDQLRNLYVKWREDPKWNDADSVKELVDKFVIPRTQGTWMGVSLQLNQNAPKEVNLLISHCWRENAKRFFDDVLAHMSRDEVAYICFLANYQGSELDITSQLGADVQQGLFSDVMQGIEENGGRILVVPNEELKDEGKGLYSRLWCNWELYQAHVKDIRITFTHRNTEEHLFGRGYSSENAECGKERDQAMIWKAIRERPPKTPGQRLHEIGILSLPNLLLKGMWSTSNACAASPCCRTKCASGTMLNTVGSVGNSPGRVGLDTAMSAITAPLRPSHDAFKALDRVVRNAARKGIAANRGVTL